MTAVKRFNLRRLALFLFLGLTGLCLASVSVSALSNRALPTRSSVVDRLSDLDKARLAEATHLRQSLGDRVWPGWGQADIPLIVYNEAYAFLVGYSDPPPGWVKVPQNEARGGTWEIVPGDDFSGQPYYRQQLPNPEITPENFTVLVGDRWVATLQTREYSLISFAEGFRGELPPVLQGIFPYQLAWRFLLGEVETYIGALLHEAFHAYQGQVAQERLAAAEFITDLENRYPWEDSQAAWDAELDALGDAALADSDSEAKALAATFLRLRSQRRSGPGMDPALAEYEGQREWLEGLAKYAELAIGRLAAGDVGYQAVNGLAADPDFNHYANKERYWALQLGEVKRISTNEGETRFYYSGLAQAALLDRLMPDWKDRAMADEIWLDVLLAEAIGQ